MGFCIAPDIMNSINTNYMIAQKNYANKRQKILEKIQQEYDVSGKDFIDTFQSYYKNIMNERIISEDTGKEVKYETILRHLYRAAEKEVYAILEQHSLNLEEELKAIQELQQQSQMNLKQQQKFLEKEVDKIVKKYADEMTINYSIDKYLPQFVSSENKGLAASQVMGYYKKLFRTEISKRLSSEAINKVVKAYPSIVLGYIREDAVSEAGRKVLEHFKMNAANAQTVGGEQTKIDILI